MIDERIPYEELTDEQQQALHEWCALHDIDHTLVPIRGTIEFDATTREWVIDLFIRDHTGIRAINGEPARRTVRRRSKAELPWPTRPIGAEAETRP